MADTQQCAYIIPETGHRCPRPARRGHTVCYPHLPFEQSIKILSQAQSAPQTQHAAKLLGSGTYGCVYTPPVKCAVNTEYNQKYKDHVMKVMNGEDAWDEIETGILINAIDPKHEYFVPMSSEWCSLDHSDPALQSCESYVNDSFGGVGYHGHFMENAGISLKEFIKSKVINVKGLISIMKHLIMGLNKLHSIGICHMDIKEPNVMMLGTRPRFIDFGLSVHKSQYTVDDVTTFYELYPPALSYITHGSTNDKMYQHYENVFKRYDSRYVRASNSDPMVEYYNQYKQSGGKAGYVKDVIVPNLEKVDVYMLGSLMYRCLATIGQPSIEHENTFNQFRELCIECRNPYISAQYGTDDVLQFMDDHKW